MYTISLPFGTRFVNVDPLYPNKYHLIPILSLSLFESALQYIFKSQIPGGITEPLI